MNLPTKPLLDELMKLKPVRDMKVTVNCAIKSGALVGLATIASGILGGPLGLAVGGVASSLVAGYCSTGKFKSVPYIILYETTPAEREKLAALIRKNLQLQHIIDLRDFLLALDSNEQLMETIIQILIMFLSSQMGRKVYTQV